MTNTTTPAPLSAEQLDQLEGIAEHLKQCDFWESGSEILEIVAQARSAAPAGQADEQANVVKALPARRFENKTGFWDADYVEFAEGCNYGGGVRDGIPHQSKPYTRAEAEGFVAEGAWREVAVPQNDEQSAPAGTARQGGITSDSASDAAPVAGQQAAPVVASLGDTKPFGWVQFIDGQQTQNIARDETELATVKEIAALFTQPGAKVEYVQVFDRPAAASQAAPVVAADERALPETTDQAREYLVDWHKANWKHAPYFSSYIRTDLAGDFAFHLARWLVRATLAPVTAQQAAAVAAPSAISMLSGALNHARDSLRFYAEQQHFHMHQPDEWDTVSGESQNFYEDSNNTATVEDGSVAKRALEDIAHVEAYASAAAPAATTSEDARDAALEEAAQMCERQEFADGDTRAKSVCKGCAAAIRSLRATQQEGE